MSPRKAITERLKVDCLLWRALQNNCIICAICGDLIEPEQRIEFDHIHAIVAEGTHEYRNIRPLHYACHKAKTKRDIALNAKAKRIAKGPKARKGRAIKSRGFDKSRSRKFDGTVIARKT